MPHKYPKEIQARLRTECFGNEMLYKQCLPSSNKALMQISEGSASEGLLLVCEEQTAGRGRENRPWFSPPGKNLYFSLLLRPSLPQRRLPELALLSAIALRRALQQALPQTEFGLKWPNDLWLQGRKISGILCESGMNAQHGLRAVIGIGLNVNCSIHDFPAELQDKVTSLQICSGKKFNRAKLLAAILLQLEKYYQRWLQSDSLAPFLPEWEQADIFRGKTVCVKQTRQEVCGLSLGLAEDGRLKIQLPDGSIKLISSGDAQQSRISPS
ncbi:MAG: biotin--[acetyl-CoA-carboxylase] ligase [Lentisphaeria bacterium]|nr:biotin--[acetyl-CoA-carboxylase] ligase [Lentisphaeria bacterium]MDY0175441.1 biotin--[acetyl-CoA-carboxylase] ligase [Lentisphaeria bacterium]NLZ59152.1 biotin--[acetyl-CoA-carboxylase] ligase [Lentisphaerota bacterium]